MTLQVEHKGRRVALGNMFGAEGCLIEHTLYQNAVCFVNLCGPNFVFRGLRGLPRNSKYHAPHSRNMHSWRLRVPKFEKPPKALGDSNDIQYQGKPRSAQACGAQTLNPAVGCLGPQHYGTPQTTLNDQSFRCLRRHGLGFRV